MGKQQLKAGPEKEPRLIGSDGNTLTLGHTMLRFWDGGERALTIARYADIRSIEVFFGDRVGEYQIQIAGRLLCRKPGSEREFNKTTVSIVLPGWSSRDVSDFLEKNSPLRTSESEERAAAEIWFARVVDAPGPRGTVTITTNNPVEELDVLVNGRKYKDLSSLEQLVTTVYAMELPLGRFVIQTRSLPANYPRFLRRWVRRIPSTSVIIELTPDDDDIVLHLESQFPIPILHRHHREG